MSEVFVGSLPSYPEQKQSCTNRSTSGHMSMSMSGTLQHVKKELAGKLPAHSCFPKARLLLQKQGRILQTARPGYRHEAVPAPVGKL
ncbi:hypothetical protein PBY51_022574 [Eleginops maclovinus]|uniref:Uncharacterized protein n=1 Tax=Eleginops maclovinus TaxID=56733 RepID=A0AAN8ANA5_ELEMC|nr:hypothetical protein PBY51_022574 [Eleginops maclovinus]